jgi:hypothetical protein
MQIHKHVSTYPQVSRKKTMSDVFPKAVQRLRSFEDLQENWNGNHALPPSHETLDHAYEILFNLSEEARKRKIIPLEPDVTCGTHGDITFSWIIEGKELELGFRVESGAPKYEYLVCETEKDTCEEGTFEGRAQDSPAFEALFSAL